MSAAATECIFVKFYTGDVYENLLKKIEIWLKSDKNIGDIKWRPKYLLLMPVTLNHHWSAVFKWIGIRLFGAPRGYKQYVNMLRCDIIHTDILLQVLLWWSCNTAHTIKIKSANHQNFHCACVLYITGSISDSNFLKPHVWRNLYGMLNILCHCQWITSHVQHFMLKHFLHAGKYWCTKIFLSFSVQGKLFKFRWHNIIWNVSLV
jgi:hypothetical protein